MLNYAICEFGGKQYKIYPNQGIEIDWQESADKNIEVKVLMLSENGKLKIGKPYLKEKLALKRLEDTKGVKIRVSKYHAKANFRKVTGFRPKFTKVVWDVKKTA